MLPDASTARTSARSTSASRDWAPALPAATTTASTTATRIARYRILAGRNITTEHTIGGCGLRSERAPRRSPASKRFAAVAGLHLHPSHPPSLDLAIPPAVAGSHG